MERNFEWIRSIPVSMGGIPESGLLEVGTWSKCTGEDLELWSAVALRRNGLVLDITRDRAKGLHVCQVRPRRSMTLGRGAASLQSVDINSIRCSPHASSICYATISIDMPRR